MRETSKFGFSIKRGAKKVVAGTLAALMVVSSVPSNSLIGTVKAADATKSVYVLYDAARGEHYLTADPSEKDGLLAIGWTEGNEAWVSPEKSNTPVYCLYNPNNGGDHYYTSNAGEKDALLAAGWQEGNVKFYSDDEKGVLINTLYNPNEIVRNHHYTKDEGEKNGLVALGWQDHTNAATAIYGVDTTVKEVEIESVTLDNTTPKVGDTINAKTEPSNVKCEYKWFSGTAKDQIKNEIKGETGKSLKVTSSMADQFIKVVVKDSEGNEKEAATEEAVVASELSLKSVESADLGTNTYLVAYFNQAVGELQPGDIEIRDVDTNTLVTVEKVTMSSDKMTANLTLVGAEAGNGASLQANVDYKMIVKTSEGTAEKVFSIPDVAKLETVRNINETKKTVTTASGTFFVPDDMDIDYEEILGRTVTVEYDKDMKITKLNVKNEKVFYGAFVVSNGTGADDAVLVDKITGEEYDDQEAVAGTSEITATRLIRRTKDGVANTANFDFDNLTDKTDAFAYAKLVLNSNGTVKAMVTCPVWSNAAVVAEGNVLVTKKVGTSVYGGTTPVDMKDYVIVKDGKKIAFADIAEGDVVFYNTSFKYAEVYNNKKTGSLTAVYDGRFTFDGTTYNVVAAGTVPANLLYRTRYIKADGGLTNVDNDYMNGLKASGKDVTVYFDRAGQPVYLTGEVAAVVSNDVTVVLTENAKLYKQSLVEYLRVKGFNGTEIKTYDIDISGLEKIDNGTNVYEKGYVPYLSGSNDATRNAQADDKQLPAALTGAAAHGSFAIDVFVAPGAPATVFSDVTGAGTISQLSKAAAPAYNDTGCTQNIIRTGTDLLKKSAVTLTTDKDGKVTAICFEDSADAGNIFEAGKAFKGGQSTVKINAGGKVYQISSSTPIYKYDNDNDKVEKIAYSEFTSATKAANAVAGSMGVHVYSMDEKNVSWVVIDSQAMDTDSTGETEVEAVVSEVEYSADSDKKMVMITLVTGDEAEAKTYTKFGKDLKTSGTIGVGDIVTVKVAGDKETINDATATAAVETNAILGVTDVAKTEFDIIKSDSTRDAGLALATSVTPTIVKINDNDEVEKINFAELATLSRDYKVNYSKITDAYVDTIVVTKTAGGSDAYTAAKALIDGLNAAQVSAANLTATNITPATSAGYEAAVLAAVTTKVHAIDGLSGATVALNTPVYTDTNTDGFNAGDTLAYSVDITLGDYTGTVLGTINTLQ